MIRRFIPACAIALLVGCSSTPAPVPEQAPPDFTVSITVLDKPGSRAQRPRDQRAARYVLGPDRTLRALVGRTTRVTQYPPPMRQLRDAQYQEVWQFVRQAGYLDLPDTAHIAESETIDPQVKKPTAVVYVRADDRQRSAIIELDATDAGTTRALIDKLGALAWVEP